MRALTQQVFGNTRARRFPAGAVADGKHGEIARVSFDWPRVWVVTADARGLDRGAGDVGQLELEITIGAGLAADTFIVPSPSYLGGFFILAASSLAIVASMSGVNLAAPRELRWSAWIAPWNYPGPETMPGFPLLNLTRGRDPETGDEKR